MSTLQERQYFTAGGHLVSIIKHDGKFNPIFGYFEKIKFKGSIKRINTTVYYDEKGMALIAVKHSDYSTEEKVYFSWKDYNIFGDLHIIYDPYIRALRLMEDL